MTTLAAPGSPALTVPGGRTEPLGGTLGGRWPRRITRAHRFALEVEIVGGRQIIEAAARRLRCGRR